MAIGLDAVGRHLGDRECRATASGYRRLIAWASSFGHVRRVGVEGTGTFGAALTRTLLAAGLAVVEVDRPDRKLRRYRGKSDPTDAFAAALAVLSGRAVWPGDRDTQSP